MSDNNNKLALERLAGRWQLTESENFDEYMKAINVGFLYRKLGNTVKPDVEFVLNEDGSVTFNTISKIKNSTINFKLNEEFEETTIDGRKVTSVITIDDNGNLEHRQSSTPPTIIVRSVQQEENKMICTVTAGDVKCTRTYVRV